MSPSFSRRSTSLPASSASAAFSGASVASSSGLSSGLASALASALSTAPSTGRSAVVSSIGSSVLCSLTCFSLSMVSRSSAQFGGAPLQRTARGADDSGAVAALLGLVLGRRLAGLGLRRRRALLLALAARLLLGLLTLRSE